MRDALRAAEVPVYPQWGVSDYRIDFALAHPDRPGHMVLALETDGDSYHKTISARDRDRLRQSQLERLGWRFSRIWSMDWYRNREAEIAKIIEDWRCASDNADNPLRPPTAGRLVTNAPANPSTPDLTMPARGPRPPIPRRARGADYADRELVAICRWLLADGLPVARTDRVTQAITELDISRRGKIVERLNHAFDLAQRNMDPAEAP